MLIPRRRISVRVLLLPFHPGLGDVTRAADRIDVGSLHAYKA